MIHTQYFQHEYKACKATAGVANNATSIQQASSETGSAAVKLLELAASLSEHAEGMNKQVSDFIKD